MEAVPRMPMLSFELKHSPEYIEFGPTLKKYIREHYGEDPAHYNKSCNDLESLRQSAVHVSHDFMGCSTLKKYYAQLQFLQGRFPMVDGAEAAIPFTWEEVHSGREICLSDIKFEQACILYNIGALHSVLGAMDTRQSADGMKVSCTHFQCASWAFEYLRDHFGCAAMSLDMSHELLTFHVHLMLAQAQECILEKSMTDSRKSTITAKVAAQIVEFYGTSLTHLDTCNSLELISSKRYKEWKKRIDLKMLFYTCITNFFMGRQSEEQQKWGQCLAYYTLSLEKLTECEKLSKNESTDIQDSLRFTHDVVGGKHQSAKKDNDFVYHDKIPAADTLPEVKGASLVKGIPFNANDPEISGPDFFMKLVPMSAHEAASLYSEEKASLLRRIASEIQEKNEELTQYLSSLQLDQTSLNPEPERLPQQLLEKCAALSVRPTAIKELVDSMTAVSNVSTDVEMGIQEIQQALQDESKAELEYQETFGKRNPNAILSEIAQECARLEAGHKKGSQSNQTLHKAMNTHINNLKLLSSPLEELQNLLPSVDKDRDPESNDIIKQLNMLLSKIEEMRTQRQGLEDELRKEIMEDDITGALCKQEGVNRDVLFAEQLKKHDKKTGHIRQNISAQNNILRALTDANSKYASVRRATGEAIARREQMIRDLINSYDVYEDLKAKSQKGLEFYKKLETNVGRLLTRCKNVCKEQQEEREKMYNKYRPKAAPVASRPQAPKPGQADMTADKLPPLNRVASPADVDMANTSLPTVPAMFDGPKLKDYLPFMKPKTFGKKDGSPPVTGAHPNVQNYLASQSGGSLPNSGTASPVHLPQTSGSVPASPDHVRQRFDGRLGPNDPSMLPRQPGPDLTQGHTDQLYMYQPPSSAGQGLLPQGQGQTLTQPRSQGQHIARQDQRQTPSPNMSTYSDGGQYPNTGQGQTQYLPGQGQNMIPPNSQQQSGNGSQYVPLDQKWKKDKAVAPIPTNLPQGQMGSAVVPQQSQVNQYTPASVPQQPTRHQQAYPTPPTQNVPLTNQFDQGQQPYGQYSQQGQGQNVPFSSQGQPVASQPVFTPQGQMPSHESMGNQPDMSQYSHQSQLPMGSMSEGNITSYPGAMPPQSMGDINQRGVTNTVSAAGGPVTSPGNEDQIMAPNLHFQGQIPQHQTSTGQGQFPLQGQLKQTFVTQNQQYGPQSLPGGPQSLPGGPQSLPGGPQSLPGGPQSLPGGPQSLPGGPQSLPGRPQVPFGQQTAALQQNQQQVSQSQHGQYDQHPSSGYQQPGKQAYQQPHKYVQSSGHGQTQVSQPQVQGHQNIGTSQGQQFPQQQVHGLQSMGPSQGQQYPQQQVQSQQSMGPSQGQQFPQQQVQGQQGVNQQYNSPNTSQQQFSSSQYPSTTQRNFTPPPASQSQGQTPYNPPQGQPTPHSQAQPLTQMQQGHVPPGQGHIQTGTPVVSQQQNPFPGQQQFQNQHPLNQGQQHQTSVPIQQPSMAQQQIPNQQQGQVPSQQGQVPSQQGQVPSQQGHVPIQQQQQQYQQPQQPQQFSQVQPSLQQQQFTHQARPSHASPVHSFQGQGQNLAGPILTAPTSTGGVHQGQGHHGQNVGQQPVSSSMGAPQFRGQTPVVAQQPQQQNTVSQSQYPQGHVQGQLPQGQGQMQYSQGHIQRPAAPSYSETSVNRQATYQMGQGQIQPVIQNQNMPSMQGQQVHQHPSTQLPQQTPSSQFQAQAVPGQPQNMQAQYGFQPTHPYQAHGNTVQGQYKQISQGQQQSGYGQQTTPQHQPSMSEAPILQPQVVTPAAPNVAQGKDLNKSPAVQTIQPPATQSQGQGQTFQPNLQQVPNYPQVPVQPKGQIQPQGAPSSSNFQSGAQGQTNYPQGPPRNASPAVPFVTQPQMPARACSPVEAKTASHPFHPVPRVPVDRHLSTASSLDRQLSTASSLDEILSSSPDGRAEPKENLLAPKVMTAQDLQQQKEDQLKNSSLQVQPKDPYTDKTKLDKFIGEVEKLAKFIEGIEKPSCSGPTPLDTMWKELMEEQERAIRQQKLAIARCYPMKNREQDIMPYDNTRVLLTTLKDDYINASWVNDLSPTCPKFIATQAPLPVTLTDFWLMICEQSIEVLVALSSDIETGKKFPVYFPCEKGESVEHGPVLLTVQSVKKKPHWTERILHLRHHETKTGRTLVHLQYNVWPVSGYPDKISHLLQFITEVHSFYRQQRSLMKPIVIHCGNGVGRTGMFQLIYVGMQEVNNGQGIINIQEVAGKMLWKRRNLLLKQDQLKFCFEAILYYAQDVLAKEGILVHKASFGDQLPKPGAKPQGWEPGEDVLFGSMSFTNLQTNVAKLGTRKTENAGHGFQSQKPETSLDEKLEMLKKDGKIDSKAQESDNQLTENTDNLLEGLNGNQISAMLPDVVQNPGITLERKNEPVVEMKSDGLVDLGVAKETSKGQGQIGDILGDLDQLRFESKGSGHSSMESKGSKPSSVTASPAHASREVSCSPKPDSLSSSSLTELQDPQKFTIGTSEGKKKKITKADFEAENRPTHEQDPNDPLSSLDPFWTVK